MPEPRDGESRDEFLDRCMGDDEAVADFPDSDQRYAFCNSKWENRDKADLTSGDLAGQGGRLLPQQGRRCPPGQRWDEERQACVPDARRHDPEACGCCGTAPAARTLLDMEVELTMLRLRQDGDESEDQGLQPLGNRRTPGHEDPFLEDELTIALALSDAAFTSADEVEGIIGPVLEDPEAFDEQRLADATEEASRAWEGTYDRADEEVAAAVALAIVHGENQVARGIIGDAPTRQEIVEGMRRVARYNTNAYFNEQVMPALQRQVLQVLDNAPATEPPDLTSIRETLNRRLRTVPYWRVVANAAASRSYHWGLLKAAQFQGRTGYQFVAVLDDRTSEICEKLNGRQWFIADAVNLMERAARDPDPASVRNYMPWVSAGTVEGLSSDALRDLGVMVPPLHGNCRSTIVPI